jgi:recombination protein RecT
LAKKETKNKNEITKSETPVSQRFMEKIRNQFITETSTDKEFSDYEKKLARDLYLKVDSQLKTLEADRVKKGGKKTPIIWKNINMEKLSMDAVHRINLGLDAMLPNHIHPIPFWNGKLNKYDLDLRIGYEGELYYKCEVAIDKPKDVRYELVHKNDNFKVIKKSSSHEVEGYEFEIEDPFNRGPVIGGFGYLIYEDPTKNKLVTVTKKELEEAEQQGNDIFWRKHKEKMQLKTVVHRTMAYIKPDPKKVNAPSYAYVEEQENYDVNLLEEDKPKRKISLDEPEDEVQDVEEYEEEIETEEIEDGEEVDLEGSIFEEVEK